MSEENKMPYEWMSPEAKAMEAKYAEQRHQSDAMLRRARQAKVRADEEYADACIISHRYYPTYNPPIDKWDGRTYIMRGFGDLTDPSYNGGYKSGLHKEKSFHSLDEALVWLEIWDVEDKFDPEDDRIVVWEVLPTGHRKPVWHASGWHWDQDEVDGVKLEQGCLLDEDESLYHMSLEDY